MTRAAGPDQQRGTYREIKTRYRCPRQMKTHRMKLRVRSYRKRRIFDVNVSSDGEALAARQSSQFKRSGVGGRLIITLAVNI